MDINRDNGLFESAPRHEFGWLDEADGVARTTITKMFLKEIETTRNYDPKHPHLLGLGGRADCTGSTNHDTGTGPSPQYILSLGRCDADIFFYVPAEIAHDTWRNVLNVAVQQTLKALQ